MAAPRLSTLAQAVLLSLSGVFLLDVMGAIIKHLGDAYPPQELAVFRNLFGLVPSALILLTSRDWHAGGRPIVIGQWKLALSRGLFVTFAQFCYYLALGHLALATTTTLAFSSPLFVTALSLPLLGDRVGAWRWLAVGIGFLGIMLILRPGSDVFTPYALLPIGAALGYAISGMLVRRITDPAPSALLNLYSHFGALIGATALTLLTGATVPVTEAADWLWIVAMGTAGGCGVLLLIMSYRLTLPSNLAPFDYFGIVFSFALGWLFFDEAPFDTLFPGVLLIVGGGILIIWRERRVRARARAAERAAEARPPEPRSEP